MEHATVAERGKDGANGVLESGIGSVAVLMTVAVVTEVVVVMESSSSSPSSDIQVEVGLHACERKVRCSAMVSRSEGQPAVVGMGQLSV